LNIKKPLCYTAESRNLYKRNALPMSNLPKGIYHEAKKNRFRVRLYVKQTVIWRSYHETLEEAQAILKQALHAQNEYKRNPPNKKPIRTIPDLVIQEE
jgi:hypothetical protein